jgi:hypothetical protein
MWLVLLVTIKNWIISSCGQNYSSGHKYVPKGLESFEIVDSKNGQNREFLPIHRFFFSKCKYWWISQEVSNFISNELANRGNNEIKRHFLTDN